jgi:tripartite-type tricarboxylate transporter receptor subunit TctC
VNAILKAGLYVVACALAVSAAAQEYPNKPIRLVAPFAPGGGTDVLARIVGQRLNERWGQAVVVDNRPGAGGNIGADLVAKSSPDGYTLMLGGVPHAISMTLYKKLPYDLARDMIATAPIATFPSMIVVHPAVGAHNVQELVSLGKAKPGALNYGSPGNGSPNHLAIELLCKLGGLKMQHIPYKSAGQVASELLGGQVQLASMGFPTAMPHVKAGKMRALAVTSASRSPMLPDLPTVAESGLPGFDVTSWYGIFAPRRTPKAVVTKLHDEVVAIVTSPDVGQRLASLGAEPYTPSLDDFAQHVRDEIAKWGKVVQESGARID